jgi:DNA-binding NtrC family response regulator
MVPSPTTVLIVDDEGGARRSLSAGLARAGHAVVEAETLAEARGKLARRRVDAVLLDHRLPDGTGLELLYELDDRLAGLPVIVLTGYATVRFAVAAMRAGAFDYLEKPVDHAQLRALLDRALARTRMQREVAALRDESSGILGRSPAMVEAVRLIRRVAASPATTVLLTGESGTGKDLAAHAIHAHSGRAGRPFTNITCSALPSALLESELFGHERGAFTDAVQRKVGLLEQADGGTVFLDEIGEMEPALQAKLLRFLEDRSFRRVGGTTDRRADVRVIAATNVDLRASVKQQRFREDLYYRLAVLTIPLPPLRERDGDVALLAMHFVDRFNRELGRDIRAVDGDALQRLSEYSWPGNVRELRNAIERAVLLATGDSLTADDFESLGEMPASDADFVLPAGGVDIREVERSLVEQALARTSGNKTRAAKLLGMNRDQIRYRLGRYRGD